MAVYRGSTCDRAAIVEEPSSLQEALAFRPKEIFVPLCFFTGYSNRQLHARVKLADAF
jgi:hypothetical protein